MQGSVQRQGKMGIYFVVNAMKNIMYRLPSEMLPIIVFIFTYFLGTLYAALSFIYISVCTMYIQVNCVRL